MSWVTPSIFCQPIGIKMEKLKRLNELEAERYNIVSSVTKDGSQTEWYDHD